MLLLLCIIWSFEGESWAKKLLELARLRPEF